MLLSTADDMTSQIDFEFKKIGAVGFNLVVLDV